MALQPIRSDTLEDSPYGGEHDACAIYLSVRKYGQSTFGTLKRSIGALIAMGHRTGFVNGEGDGAGVQTDIPRRLWAKKLSQAGLRASLTSHPGFWVGHLFVPAAEDKPELHDHIQAAFDQVGLNLIYQQPGRTRPEALGGNARREPPAFWQVAGYADLPMLDKRLLQVQTSLEAAAPIHFLSLSPHVVVYKVRGSVETLSRYFPDLQDRNYDTAVVLCHARYSTNTNSSFDRAQPFALLGHNGEINTIARLRLEAGQIGAVLPKNGSDSQDLDRTLHTLVTHYGLDLVEAMETIFPPVPFELERFSPEQRAVYTRIRQSFGPYAQGPAAILARCGDAIVASVDAVGLRPLWYVETEKEHIFSSERGAIPLEVVVADPRALGPGEKMAIFLKRGENSNLLNMAEIRQHVVNRAFQREAPQLARQYWTAWEVTGQRSRSGVSEIPMPPQEAHQPPAEPAVPSQTPPWLLPGGSPPLEDSLLGANGWNLDHLAELEDLVFKSREVTSLGFDGPLAVLSRKRVNTADFFKETVAVVTNPAIDRNREMEVFSTSSLFGASPEIGKAPNPQDTLVTLTVPLLTGGHASLGEPGDLQALAAEAGTLSLEALLEAFAGRSAVLALGVLPGEDVSAALERLAAQAAAAVEAGCQCLVLDDSGTQTSGQGWLEPLLAVSRVDDALRQGSANHPGSLRRLAGVAVRSAAIRSLHDIALLSGFGADAIAPYAMFAAAARGALKREAQPLQAQAALLAGLKTGLEKVISTMGCHELRGYGRVCSSIGLASGVAAVLRAPNYFGSENAGLTWERLNRESAERGQELQSPENARRLEHIDHFFPRLWKKVGEFTRSASDYEEVVSTFRALKAEIPVALRHVLGFKKAGGTLIPSQVELGVRDHNLPFVISAMSFGSQGETAFRAYAEAALRLNILCINGEGGELPEMLGAYRQNRGQQVASGRFGVNSEFLNSALVLEIKIGQGAKPGEGGMLPGFKVSPRVAQARRTPAFVPLLSPSNNHDLYSIEDLAQLIEELKVVNPLARVSVKCPVVPAIGVIAVGIAKAGADIISLSGYDGGTGAARRHALQYAGLPVEIGVIQAHRALVEAGLRHKVEIWADGGMKTGEDVVKMVLMGANRVGFGTLVMVAIGCTLCRKCEEGTCMAGITTQIRTVEEARQQGLKVFNPLDEEAAVERLVRLFRGMEEEVRRIAARLGVPRLQDLVGRGDLLEQTAFHERVDLSSLCQAVPILPRPGLEPGVGRLLVRPRNNLTRLLSELITETITEDEEREITYQDSVMAIDRALGAHIVGALSRRPEVQQRVERLHLRFGPSSVAGNGFAAWLADPLDVVIEGGAQDGTAKGAAGGRVAVMKGINHEGLRIDGSVGKSFAYGAQQGLLIVQGNADSRACIRLSGAEVVFGGEITAPVDEDTLTTSTTANLKGFACEYMTAGRVVILGDPGPYAFSGMTGGVVYQMLTPALGFDTAALQRRIALGAQVSVQPLAEDDLPDLQRLLGCYAEALEQTYQYETAEQVHAQCTPEALLERFVRIVPQPPTAIKQPLAVMAEDAAE